MKTSAFSHNSVLLQESICGLNIKSDGIYVDGTAGGAGHSIEIAKKLTSGKLFAFDRDPDAVEVCEDRLSKYPVEVINDNFCEMEHCLKERNVYEVDGVLIDLGVSSYQLDNPERGFSYRHDGILDMRMSKDGFTAADVVNGYSEVDLTHILRKYGEEKFSRAIARNIVKRRGQKPIERTSELADIIKYSIPAKARRDKNPCKRSFQAIRIVVNGELDSLESGIECAFNMLKPGGRLAIITFHSLEDRIVKHKYIDWSKGCICSPGSPICICGNVPMAKIINKKAIEPSEQEKKNNRRSQSAKLRILEKL